MVRHYGADRRRPRKRGSAPRCQPFGSLTLPRSPTAHGLCTPTAPTYTAYNEVVPVINNRFRFGPPKATFDTVSGTLIFPSNTPLGSKQCTPSPALVHRLPFVSIRNPSAQPGETSAKTFPGPKPLPSAVTGKTRIWRSPPILCEIPVSAI